MTTGLIVVFVSLGGVAAAAITAFIITIVKLFKAHDQTLEAKAWATKLEVDNAKLRDGYDSLLQTAEACKSETAREKAARIEVEGQRDRLHVQLVKLGDPGGAVQALNAEMARIAGGQK